MTIQLLHPYNGNAPGVYSSMGSTEEARLIGLGLARAYTPGMDGQNPVFSNGEQLAIRGVVSAAGNMTVNSRDGMGRATAWVDTAGVTWTATYGDDGPATVSGGGKTRTFNYVAGLLVGFTES